jgi:hypothetical protein
MIASAIFMALCGGVATFAPRELLNFADMSYTATLLAGVQLFGAMYLGFAILNWMSKDSLIGGIYNRPIVMANALHFFAGAMSLIRAFSRHDHPFTWTVTALYALFAFGFFWAMFHSPVKEAKP